MVRRDQDGTYMCMYMHMYGTYMCMYMHMYMHMSHVHAHVHVPKTREPIYLSRSELTRNGPWQVGSELGPGE